MKHAGYLAACAMLTFAVGTLLTALIRRVALRAGLIDRPNPRSSHVEPTPRGGGIAIVVVSLVAFAVFATTGDLDWPIALALGCGGVLIACVGFIDDRMSLSPLIRLIAQSVAAFGGLYLLGGSPALQFGAMVVDLGVVGIVLATLATVWMVNLYNFMDGIDGIAATEGAFVVFAGGAITCMSGGALGVPAAAFAIGGACTGFLLWNWQPARIFMGDVGSSFLGFAIAILALAATLERPSALFVWLILSGAFVADATITLLRRFARGERVYQAHRTHAYQWLSRRWRSHQRVTMLLVAIDLLWLLPLAWYASRYPEFAAWATSVALFPLVILALLAGAGRPESPD